MLHPPDFIYACQRTLSAIEDILRKFEHVSLKSTPTAVQASRFNVSNLRRMDAKDLKWPLRKSRTIELIEELERHKSTCTLALAENSLVAVHSVLEQSKISNKSLAMLKKKQEKLLESNITDKQGMYNSKRGGTLDRYFLRFALFRRWCFHYQSVTEACLTV